MADADIERPMNTFVDRISDDMRRIYRDIIPVAPPSPIKNAREAAAQSSSSSRAEAWSTVPDAEDEHYEMFNEPEDDPPLEIPRTRKSAKRALYSVSSASLTFVGLGFEVV
jgi:hypothetical protein